jgi:hypothetical protein
MRVPRGLLYVAGVFLMLGMGWGLPASESWAADAVSPRASGLFALVETYRPGHHHIYPPLHTLFLTALALPVHLWAVFRVGTDPAALERALIGVAPMTVLELSARLLTWCMALGVVHRRTRLALGELTADATGVAPDLAPDQLGERRFVAWCAGLSLLGVGPFVYYAKTGNLDVPALFWALLALTELQTFLMGTVNGHAAAPPPRRLNVARCMPIFRLAIFSTAAVLTKDQAAGLLIVPVLAALWARRTLLRALWPSIWRALALAVALYMVVSGALVNPTGYAARIRELFGPASATWEAYPRTPEGHAQLARALAVGLPEASSWPLSIAALLGLLLAGFDKRLRSLSFALPALASLSFALTFTFGARRTEERFLMPHLVLLVPYAASTLLRVRRALGRVLPRSPKLASALVALCAVAVVGSALQTGAAMIATLYGDPRYEAEEFLLAQPAEARVEVYGGPKFLPRVWRQTDVTRVGTDPVAGRSHLPGVEELEADPLAGLASRAPEFIVLSTEFSRPVAAAGAPWGVNAYVDDASRRFFQQLIDDRLPYERVLTARCRAPSPLQCRRVHGSTGEEVWVYRRRRSS